MSIVDSDSHCDKQTPHIFRFSSDPIRSFTYLVRVNSFNWIDPTFIEAIRTQAVPFASKGNRKQENQQARYFAFNLSPEEVLKKIKEIDQHSPWRLAQSKELLSFAASFPEEQITRKIIGGGIDSSDPRSLILGGDSFRQRFLQYHCLPPKADPTSFFLGVRKISDR